MSSFKQIRQRFELTQQQLADLTGIPLRTIQNWEGGQRTPPEYIEKLLLFYLEHIKEEPRE